MKKKVLSPEKAKIISTLLVSIIFLFIVLSMTRLYTNRMIEKAKEDYFESVNTTLDAFERIVSLQLNSYKSILNAYYRDILINTPDYDLKTITKNLEEYNESKSSDILDFYFLTPEGKAYLSDGTTTMMNPENHKGLEGIKDFYISDLCYPANRHAYVFCMEKTCYREGNVVGVLGFSIILDNFQKKTTGLIGDRENFMLLDKNGYFLVHSRPDVIGKQYIPEDSRYENTSTINLAKNPPSTYTSQADDGSTIYLITSKIPESGWTISLKVTMDEIDEIYDIQRRAEFMIFIFAFLTILGLVIVETKILDFFQKKQLISTVYDPLTNLWTRQRFEIEANKMVRNPRAKFMLIEADIRGFKFINQTYGEEAADNLIVYYSKILNKCIGDYHGIIGHGFADHFYILAKITSVHKAMNVFRDAMTKITDDVKSYEIPFFPKFGISFLMPGDNPTGNKIQNLIGQASFAKSTIKDNLLTQFSVYNSKLLEKINEEQFIESHMQQALDQKEFFVMYQPKISLTDDKIVGAEALVRWNSPKLGLMTPDKFIPLFEKNGFITKLDYYVYEEVFKFLQNRLAKNLPIVPISVNMSRNHNKPDKFIHDFMEIFTKYSIPPSLIQIEILERSVMDNTTLQDITEKLHKEGFSVAMDDFGSGESSLNMLTKIPVDVLKFDREFLNASTDKEGRIDKKSEKFIHILIDLSKNLEKQTVFEGVETQAQRDFLRSINCDQAQGYFYSKPLAEQDFVQFIKLHS
jgi:EAL domain-containing protein (putative c-di-GMP-specific phosphodiesterase class I)/GGDEF domain-containing protein